MISRILSRISFGQVQLLQNEMAIIFPLNETYFSNYQSLHPGEVIVRDWFSCPTTTNPVVGTALCSHPRKYSGACHNNVSQFLKWHPYFWMYFICLISVIYLGYINSLLNIFVSETCVHEGICYEWASLKCSIDGKEETLTPNAGPCACDNMEVLMEQTHEISEGWIIYN